MKYVPEEMLQAYENRLRRHSLNIGRKQWKILEEVVEEYYPSTNLESENVLAQKVDLDLLRCNPEGSTKDSEKLYGMRLTRLCSSVGLMYQKPIDEITNGELVRWYEGCIQPDGKLLCPYHNTGIKSVKVLETYLIKKGLAKVAREEKKV
jgi:hypothetical protein